jgi:hypothetical protein
MKKPATPYWILTGLMAALMLAASVPDVLQLPLAVATFMHLGYPTYLLPFIGTAKIMGVVVIILPGLPRLKEWAYAGLVFDLVGALYSHLSVGDAADSWLPAALGLLLAVASYALHRQLARASLRLAQW